MGPVTALAGVCLQDVEGAHEGGKRLLASRLRPVSSKATHPPTYLPLHRYTKAKSVLQLGSAIGTKVKQVLWAATPATMAEATPPQGRPPLGRPPPQQPFQAFTPTPPAARAPSYGTETHGFPGRVPRRDGRPWSP